MKYPQIEKFPTLFYFIDTEKAFDGVEWQFMKQLIEHKGLGLQFQMWINLIYNKQIVNISLEGCTSQKIKMHRGVRQGCLVSLYCLICLKRFILKNM